LSDLVRRRQLQLCLQLPLLQALSRLLQQQHHWYCRFAAVLLLLLPVLRLPVGCANHAAV
jgi:hypothetical protein